MNKHSLKQFDLLERRLDALRMWRLGYKLKAIGERLGVSLTTAWSDIDDAHRRIQLMAEITKKDKRLDGWVQQEIIKQEALQAWERSKEDAIEITEVPDPEDPGRMIVKERKRKPQCGDARYLATAQKAEERQAKIYGTDMSPDQLDPFADEGDETNDGSTVRGTVVGRNEADQRAGARYVELLDAPPSPPPSSPEAPEAPLQQTGRTVRKKRANQGVRRGARVRKK